MKKKILSTFHFLACIIIGTTQYLYGGFSPEKPEIMIINASEKKIPILDITVQFIDTTGKTALEIVTLHDIKAATKWLKEPKPQNPELPKVKKLVDMENLESVKIVKFKPSDPTDPFCSTVKFPEGTTDEFFLITLNPNNEFKIKNGKKYRRLLHITGYNERKAFYAAINKLCKPSSGK